MMMMMMMMMIVVVIIDILLRTRAAMHTTIAAAALWQFEATQNRFVYSLVIISLFLACYHVSKMIFCAFVGPPFCGSPVRPNMLNMPKSASGTYIDTYTYLRTDRLLCTARCWRRT